MKIKTSLTLSEDLLQQVDQLAEQYGTRSAIIEQAVQEFVTLVARRSRDTRDVEILNRRARSLNAEADKVLAYQVEL